MNRRQISRWRGRWGVVAGAVVLVCGAAVAAPQLLEASDLALELAPADPGAQELVVRARAALPVVPVRGRAAKTGYERDLFGEGWAVVSGCDMRNRTLARDLTRVVYRPGTNDCVVESGTLADPYTGDTIEFLRGNETSTLVQIDHVVPLSLSWQQGAQQWTPEQREAFANDPANLQATDGPTNGQKSDSGPGSWLPPDRSYRCEYVARFVLVVEDHKLSINPGDHDQISRTLERC